MNQQYRILSLAVLEKALDDICPRFHNENPQIKKVLVKQRVQYFAQQEKNLDKEWEDLIKEAYISFDNLEKERLSVIKKIKKTQKTKKIAQKIQTIKRAKNNKIKSLKLKLTTETSRLKKQLKTLREGTKKHKQIANKLEVFTTTTENRIRTLNTKYDESVAALLASDNTANVEKRVAQAYNIWEREKTKLTKYYGEQVSGFEANEEEHDQIRIAIDWFVNDVPEVLKWCDTAKISPVMCYQEVRDRIKTLGRDAAPVEAILSTL